MMHKCLWDGDCDHCGAGHCIATYSQAMKFYTREEQRAKERYSIEAYHPSNRKKYKKITKEDAVFILSADKNGMSHAKIAEKLGVTSGTITRFFKRLKEREEYEN